MDKSNNFNVSSMETIHDGAISTVVTYTAPSDGLLLANMSCTNIQYSGLNIAINGVLRMGVITAGTESNQNTQSVLVNKNDVITMTPHPNGGWVSAQFIPRV